MFIEDEEDFSDFLNVPIDEGMVGIFTGLIETRKTQLALTLELTTLVVRKSNAGLMNEEKIFSVFERSVKVIAGNFSLKALLEEFKN